MSFVDYNAITDSIVQPDVILCNKNYNKICELTPIENLKIHNSANAIDEIAFSIHKENNGVVFENWDKIADLKVVHIKRGTKSQYFEIQVDVADDEDTVKNITGYSIETELAQVNVEISFNGEADRLNSANFNANGEYSSTVIYDENDASHSLLDRLLDKAPHWSIGSVSQYITINDVQVLTNTVVRSFDFSTNIYDALMAIEKELDVVFTFNTVNRTINMYDSNGIGQDTTVYVDKKNLAKSFTRSSKKDEIKNCFKIVGGDDNVTSAVMAVNPNGSQYIYNFSDDIKEDMSDELKSVIESYNTSYENAKVSYYKQLCTNLYDTMDEKDALMYTNSPTRTAVDTTATAELAKLTAQTIGNIPMDSITNITKRGAERNITMIAQVMIDYRYTLSLQDGVWDEENKTWTGKFVVINATDDTEKATSTDTTLTFVAGTEIELLQKKINDIIGVEYNIDDITDMTAFKTKLQDYSITLIDTYFYQPYKECCNTLVDAGYAVDTSEFYSTYQTYHNKELACKEVLDALNTQYKVLENTEKNYESQIEEARTSLDFDYLLAHNDYNIDLTTEFYSYKREDTYKNENYISDGLTNAELLTKAEELVKVATKELEKASTFQCAYTANLNNLFTNKVFEPFFEQFDLFNWIRAEVDETVILLRLIGITIDYSNPDSIEVEFSEQIKNGSIYSDLADIIQQSKSMATSYSSTIRQAENGEKAYSSFSSIKAEGLNSALYNIKNANEEVVIDNNGINCRSMNDNGDYDERELRITGNNIVMTDDSWNTAKMAIGRGKYNNEEKYGIWADLLVGDLIVGQNMIISNSSNTLTIDGQGLSLKKTDDNSDVFSVLNDGSAYFKGKIEANEGYFNGRVFVEGGDVVIDVCPDNENVFDISKKTNIGEIRDWEESDIALNLTPYSDITQQYYGRNKQFSQYSFIEMNGEQYFLYKYTIRKYDRNNNTWIQLHDFSGQSFTSMNDWHGTYTYPLKYGLNNKFVENDYNDNCLYIYVGESSSGSDTHSGYLCKYDVENDIFTNMYFLSGNYEIGHYEYCASYYCQFQPIINNDILYVDGIYDGTRYSNAYFELSEKSVGATIAQSLWGDGTVCLTNFIKLNGELYCIIYGYSGDSVWSFAKINNLKTKDITIISDLYTYSISNTENGYQYWRYIYSYGLTTTSNGTCYNSHISIFKNNNDIYIVPLKSGNSSYFVYSNGQINEYENLPALDYVFYPEGIDYERYYYPLHNGIGFFSDGNKIHCYSCYNIDGSEHTYIKHHTFDGVDVNYTLESVMHVSENGSSYFKGCVVAESLILGDEVTIENSKINGLSSAIANAIENACNIETITDENGNQIITTTINGVTTKTIIPYGSNGCIYTDVGLGDEDDDSKTYFKVSGDGLLMCNNAIIQGTIFANDGNIAGCKITSSSISIATEVVTENDTRTYTYTDEMIIDHNGFRSRSGSFGYDAFAQLYGGKIICGKYDSANEWSAGDNQYLDISAKGLFCVSAYTAINQDERYMFCCDLDTDQVRITNTSIDTPALEISNSGKGCCLELYTNEASYKNRAINAKVTTATGENSNVVIFGEQSDNLNRVVFRCDKSYFTLNENGEKEYTHLSSDQGAIGTTNYRWNEGYFNNLYSTNAVSTSDSKKKDIVKQMTPEESIAFVNALSPYEYTFKDSENKRVHMGFLAQDVSRKAKDLEMGDMSIYEAIGFTEEGKECYYSNDIPDERLSWGLKYNEFIAPLVGSVQYLAKENERLNKRISDLEKNS